MSLTSMTSLPPDRAAPFGSIPRDSERFIALMRLALAALTMAAAVTTRLKVGTGICLVIERDTIVTAKAAATPAAALFHQFSALGTAQRHLQANLNPELTLDILGLRLQRRGQDHAR